MKENQLVKERDPFFDSLKFVLMVLVVWGHTIELYYSISSAKVIMYCSIYAFHMPLFVFVSGYFSKNMTLSRFRKGLPDLLIPYFIFQAILLIPNMLNGTFSLVQYLTEPQVLMWYLPVLIIWRLIACFLRKVRFWIIFTSALLLSLLVGFVLPSNTMIRVFSFLPYFILGLYCTPNIIKKMRSLNKFLVLTFLGIAFFVLNYFMTTGLSIFFCGAVDYSETIYYSTSQAFLFKLVSYPIAIILSYLVICATPTKLFPKVGQKTMYIYLVHGVLVYLVYQPILKHYNYLTSTKDDFLAFLIIFVLSYLSAYIKPIQFIVSPMTYLKKQKR